MYIKILAVGKLKSDYSGLAADLLKRLGSWNVEVVELKELGDLPSDYFCVLLDAEGKQMTSEYFAKFLRKKRDFEGGKIYFVIGGPHGFSEEEKSRFDLRLSMGRMTFTHQMTRILLLEQLFRAFCIITGRAYHY